MTAEAETKERFKYVFKVKSINDLTLLIRLIEVLGLKQGEYTFNKTNNTIEVIRTTNWETELTNKIKELGFENILKGYSYGTETQCKYDSVSREYVSLDNLNDLYKEIVLNNKLNLIEFVRTEINHADSTVIVSYKIMPNSKINLTDYAVALVIILLFS